MISENKKPWILEGYALFAKDGPRGLKIESIARNVNKSKSSFYHHFADIELFTEALLDYHLERAKIITQREALCKNINPDFIHLLIEAKQDLLFNRQLRVNRMVLAFKNCFEKSNSLVEDAFLDIWARDVGFEYKTNLASTVLSLVLENFYLQITEETLTYEWLVNYFNEIRSMVIEFQK